MVSVSVGLLALVFLIIMGSSIGFGKTLAIAIAGTFLSIVSTLAGVLTDIVAALSQAATALTG